MAKKIIIAFSSEPTVGQAFNYTIQVNGLNLIYPNGLGYLSFEYEAFGGTNPNKVALQGGLTFTINATLAFLIANFPSPGITYTRVNNTIEVSIDFLESIIVYLNYSNPNITLSAEDVDNFNNIGLKYFFQYKNIVDDEYICQIFKKQYTGASTEINGFAIIEKASVNNHLDPIRGGGLSLQLEASTDLTLEDLYTEDEQDFTVKLYKNNKIVFYGYMNPDGVFQDYVIDEWRITLDCVDGLGAISNLSFVQDNGLQFTGKMKAIDIIYYCLKRTGILLNINTSINTLYDGLTDSDDILRSIYLNTDRFKRSDNDTIMSCEDVLKSILDIFKAVITQIDGEWYIYKPNEIYIEPYVVFRRFDTTNNYIGNKTINLNKSLGSQIDNFYPHHCGGNQRIEIKGSVGGFRLNYKYGFVSGLMPNPKLIKNDGALDYDNWTLFDTFTMINDPLKQSGFYFKNTDDYASTTTKASSDPLAVAIDDDLSFKITYDVNSNAGSSFIRMKIQQGIYFLKYTPKNQYTPTEDIKNAVWTTNSADRFTFYLPNKVGTVTAQLPKILSNGTIIMSFMNIVNAGTNTTTFISEFDIIPTQSELTIDGEFHTVERSSRKSSIVKQNQTVYNGDNPSDVYSGAIFDENQNPTTVWNRKNSLDKLPLLRIAAEEELRIAQRPTKIFRGDFYGYIPYLSLIDINNVGKFMPIEYSYNTMTNVTTCKQLELFVPEMTDIMYNYTIDYGETVKPTLK